MAACNNDMTPFDSWKALIWKLLSTGQVKPEYGRGISALHGSVELMRMIFNLVPWPEMFLKFEGHKRVIEVLGPEKLIELLGHEKFIELLGHEKFIDLLFQEILRVNPGAVDSEGEPLDEERLRRGLRLNPNGSIYDWNLGGCRLQRLPDLIGAIRGAESISFAHNQLTELPGTFGDIQVVDKLWLNHNQLSSLPSSFGNLKCANLFLHNNKLSSLPPSFCKLRLKTLFLHANMLQKLPDGFGDIHVEDQIYLKMNMLQEDDIPSSFPNVGDAVLAQIQYV